MREGKCMCSRSLVSAVAIGLLAFGTSAFGQVNPTGSTALELVPIGSTGPVTSLTGNDIVIPGGGVIVELELRVSGWAATGDGLIQSIQGTIDGNSYCSGLGDALNPVAYPGAPIPSADQAGPGALTCPFGQGFCQGGSTPGIACQTSITDCAGGGTCVFGCTGVGTVCEQGGFVSKDACTADGAPCPNGAGDCTGGGNFCVANPNYLFTGFNPLTPIAYPGLSYQFSGVSQAGGKADAGLSEMFGTLLVEVPAGAAGTYTINFELNTEITFNADGKGLSWAIPNLTAATITITAGSCCFDIGPGTTGCVENVTASTCAAAGQPSAFRASEACPPIGNTNVGPDAGVGSDCPNCQSDLDCNDTNACTDDTCNTATGVCSNTPNFNDAADCCNPADGSLVGIDDFDVCTADSCDAGTGIVANDPAVGSCDDGRACTIDDVCDGVSSQLNGGCAGTDVNTISCAVDACPLGECDATTQLCVCSEDTPIGVGFLGGSCALAGTACAIDADCPMGDNCIRGNFTDPNCYAAGETILTSVAIGSGSEEVAGGQFLINYDPTCMQLNSVGPCAGSIFDNVISVEIDEAAGTIFYAATSDPFNPVSTPGPADMVCLNYTKIGACNSCEICLSDNNPRRTILTNISGNQVPVALTGCSKSIRDAGDLSISTPGDVDTNSNCDATFATVGWNAPSADNSCEGPLTVSCQAQHSDPSIAQTTVDSWILGGGNIPQGTAFFICSANDSCGSAQSNLWTVRVSDQQSLDVEVQLSPDMNSGMFSRAITFDLYADCASDPTSVCEVLEFGGPFNFAAHANASLKINKNNYSCVTAKDSLHTLRACATPECIGGSWTAQWKGDPLQGGNWLIGGNLDCAKAGNSHGNANTINIVDFGVFMAEIVAGSSYAPRGDTACDTAFPHGDVNADGAVDSLDYTFLLENFLADSKNCCCPAPVAAVNGDDGSSVSVKKLRADGNGDLVVADINGDGFVDTTDMALFMQGVLPQVDNTKVRKSVRSSSR